MTAELHQLHPKPTPDAFDRFWAAYPKKHKIGPARRQWMWALVAVNNDAELLIAGAERYAAYCKRMGTEEHYIASASNWLMDERWHDVYEQPQTAPDPRMDELKRKASMWARREQGRFYADWCKTNITDRDVAEMRGAGLISN